MHAAFPRRSSRTVKLTGSVCRSRSIFSSSTGTWSNIAHDDQLEQGGIAREFSSSRSFASSVAAAVSPAIVRGDIGTASVIECFDIVPIEGKGLGCIATRDIEFGELVLQEKPLITFRPNGRSPEADHLDIIEKFEKLSEADKKKYLNLHANPDTLEGLCSSKRYTETQSRAIAIVFSNAFTFQVLDGGDSNVVDPCVADVFKIADDDPKNTNYPPKTDSNPMIALLPDGSRFNHSCRPSISRSFVDGHVRWHATRAIKAGEEICNSYCDITEPTRKRRKYLSQSGYGFDCRCEVCSLPSRKQAVRDKRANRMTELVRVLAGEAKNYGNNQLWQDTIRDISLELELDANHNDTTSVNTVLDAIFEQFRQERLMVPKFMAIGGSIGFQCAMYSKDVVSAKRWLNWVNQGLVMDVGESHRLTQLVREYIDDPTRFPL